MNSSLFSYLSQEWETPTDFYNVLNDEFHFTLDPCSTDLNAKCVKHFTKEQDGLLQDWTGETVFCNPPYGRVISRWVLKALNSRADTVLFIPARTDTKWFHDYVLDKAEIRFIRGRVCFEVSGKPFGLAPFPSMLVIYRNLDRGAL